MTSETKAAWVVSADKAPGCVVVFHNEFEIARLEGAHQFDLNEDQVSCIRESRYDCFADDGHISPHQMLADGYWFYCVHCGIRIHEDNPDTPLARVLVNTDGEVFCQPKCAIAHESVRKERNQRFEAFKKRLQEGRPDLNFVNFHGGYPQRFDRAHFEFPGGMFPGTVQETGEGLRWCVFEVDAEAWEKNEDEREKNLHK
jgi:hypothetical protein